MTASQKKTQGRRKIEMKRIESNTQRRVTFAKRKKTLLRNAHTFSTLFGRQVALILSSPGGRFFTFGVPDADSVVDRYIADQSPSQSMYPSIPPCQTAAQGSVDKAGVPAQSWWDYMTDGSVASPSQSISPSVPPCRTAAPGSVDNAGVPAQPWWECPIEGMGVEELERYCASLEALRDNVRRRELELYCASLEALLNS